MAKLGTDWLYRWAALLAVMCCLALASPLAAQEPAPDLAEEVAEGEVSPDEAALAEEAARQRAEAEAARAAAEAERQQLLAAERARLRTAREAVEAEAARLDNAAAELELIEADALSWRQQAAAIAASPGSEATADILYEDLIEALREVRADLSVSLQRGGAAGTQPLLVIPPVDPALVTSGEEGQQLLAFQGALTRRVELLGARQTQLLGERRDTLYDAMITMNEARLSLIPGLSPELRSRVTGFGSEGFDQVMREVKQIALTSRYNLSTGFADLKNFGSGLLEFRADEVLDLLKFLLVILGFRFWRSVGKNIVGELRRAQAHRKPPTLLSSILEYIFRVLGHALRPIDWLALLLILDWIFPWFFDPAPIRLLWLLACWAAGGAALVLVIDAMARGGSDEDPRAELRKRSLRLVAAVVIGVGLVLSLTANVVGRGAIYSWLLTFCWLLAIPLILIITTWWHERIETLARLGAPNSRLLAWVSRNPHGITGALGRILAGIFLMVRGAQVVVARRIRQLGLIREILGQRAREKASERVIADEESGKYIPISDEEAERLHPHDDDADYHDADLPGPAQARAVLPGHVMAVIGNRGYGKTTAMRRLCGNSELPVIALQANGHDDTLAMLAKELGCEADAESISTTLIANPHCVAIDDVQRTIVPAIGGLAEFDRLIELARHMPGPTSWVFGIDAAIWPYLQRARFDRPLFDDEIRLRPWSEKQIRSLIEQRTEKAGFEPDLDISAEDTGNLLLDEEIPPEERAKRAFFSALTEDTNGNPAVALEHWRRSLFRDKLSAVLSVRTFKAPDIGRLAAMPQGTLFVLRVILQMDVASFDDIVLATDLAPNRVREILRTCELLGVIVRHGEGYRLTLYWLQEVKRMLSAQNLIAGVLP